MIRFCEQGVNHYNQVEAAKKWTKIVMFSSESLKYQYKNT